jgi:hypothetical protein
MVTRRFLLESAAAAAAYSAQGFRGARAENAPGVTDTEIKIGQTMPYSGSASAYGVIGRAEIAYFKMINEHGGLNGRKINLVSLDDAYTRRTQSSRRAALSSRSGSPSSSVARGLHQSRGPKISQQQQNPASVPGGRGRHRRRPRALSLDNWPQSGNFKRSPHLREIHSSDQAEYENRSALSARRSLQDLCHRHARGPRARKRVDDCRGILLRTFGADGRFPNHQPARVRRGYAHHRRYPQGRSASDSQGL